MQNSEDEIKNEILKKINMIKLDMNKRFNTLDIRLEDMKTRLENVKHQQANILKVII